MTDSAALATFTRSFREATGHEGAIGHFAFGDSPALAEELGKLVLTGPKRATAGWVEDEDATPAVGGHDVVLGGQGQPLCIIRTTEVRTVAFREADPAFAWDEGEGDRTLAGWRDAHQRYFARRSELLGVAFDDDSLVNLERFEVVWPELPPDPPLVSGDGIVVRPIRPDERDWVRTVTGGTTSSRGPDDGWPTDRLPALLARQDLRTAGCLVFHPDPKPGTTEVVATALLADDSAVDGALRGALSELARTYRWAHPKG